MKRLIPLGLALLLLTSLASAQLRTVGVTPFNLEIGARSLAMGGAFVGLADDANAALSNPGGLAWVKGIALTYKDFDNFTAIQAYPTGYNSSLGLAVISSRVSDIPVSSGLASSNSSLVHLSYGSKLNFLPDLYKNEAFQRIGVGLNLKGLLGQTLNETGQRDRSGYGWDLDLGILWKGGEWWSAGACAQNIIPAKLLGGGEIKWDVQGEEAVPSTLKVGAAGKVIGDIFSPVFMEGRELTLAGEIDFSSAYSTLLRLGGEWGIDKTYFFRAGLMQQWRPAGVATNLNFGLGLRGNEWGADLLNYTEPVKQQNVWYLAILYFPKEWVVVKKLDVERPAMVLEKAIEKISLVDNIVTYDDRIEVVGKVKSGVAVYVNGFHAATDNDNIFKTIVPLQMEKNLVVVEARYEGEKKVWTYKVLRKAKVAVAEEKEVLKEIKEVTTPETRVVLEKKIKKVQQQKEKVEELVTLGVIEVTPEAEFKLDASITRGELAIWLAKASGLPLPTVDKDPFPDVRRDNPAAPFIKAVTEWDLLRPYPDGSFRPNAPVTKEEGEQLFKLLRVQR